MLLLFCFLHETSRATGSPTYSNPLSQAGILMTNAIFAQISCVLHHPVPVHRRRHLMLSLVRPVHGESYILDSAQVLRAVQRKAEA